VVFKIGFGSQQNADRPNAAEAAEVIALEVRQPRRIDAIVACAVANENDVVRFVGPQRVFHGIADERFIDRRRQAGVEKTQQRFSLSTAPIRRGDARRQNDACAAKHKCGRNNAPSTHIGSILSSSEAT
jgi:hypothetical protein